MIKGALVGTCSSDFVQTILRVRYFPPHFYYELLIVDILKSVMKSAITILFVKVFKKDIHTFYFLV